MKGISLSIETVIVLVLASVVLVALLFFFSGTFNHGQAKIKSTFDLTQWCSNYANAYPNCNKITDVDVSTLNGIKKACGDAYESCNRGIGLNLECIQQCCSTFCPKTVEKETKENRRVS